MASIMKNEDLENAQGVIKKVSRFFITHKDIMTIFECSKSKAYDIVKEVNVCAKENGERPLPAGKANKYTFARLYGIPIEDVDRIINNG